MQRRERGVGSNCRGSRCPILLRDKLWVEEGKSTVSKSGRGKGERSFGEAAGLGEKWRRQ